MTSSLDKLLTFIREVYNEPDSFIPLHEPSFTGNEKQYLNECIDSNFVSSVGEFVGRFEQMCAQYTGARYAVASMNGTSALHIALHLAGVRSGDEVITQALTFIATANAISYTGANPVFLDVDRNTLGLSHDALINWLDENAEVKDSPYNNGRKQAFNKLSGRRIAACVPMHTFGHPVRIEEIKEILGEYYIPLVEDAAESIGSYYKGKHTGIFGNSGILSFNGNKLITTGGGGMILTNDEETALAAKHLTTQAKIPHAWEYRHDHIGYNYRLTNIAAALGCAQMEALDNLLEAKKDVAAKYRAFFEDSEYTFFDEPENCESNYWLNVLIAPDRNKRDELLEYSNNNGVMTRPVWEPMHQLPMFAHCQTDGLENTLWLADRIVNIPSSAVLK
jgi:aminotransferase in exopolysaccharide biosynthesis